MKQCEIKQTELFMAAFSAIIFHWHLHLRKKANNQRVKNSPLHLFLSIEAHLLSWLNYATVESKIMITIITVTIQ
jgi:hypothetical protein